MQEALDKAKDAAINCLWEARHATVGVVSDPDKRDEFIVRLRLAIAQFDAAWTQDVRDHVVLSSQDPSRRFGSGPERPERTPCA